MFFKGSRYEKVARGEHADERGRVVRYVKLRRIPPTNPQRRHLLREGERLDLLAWRYYRDAERFWRICDANLAMWPDDLTDDGRDTIGIPPAKG